jgi:hypothetical protein
LRMTVLALTGSCDGSGIMDRPPSGYVSFTNL